jgi:protein-S-isoprenylcysteine O-methyltransferase Ste14
VTPRVDGSGRSRKRAAVGTAAFVVFGGPAMVAGLGPWLITGWRVRHAFLDWTPFRWLGIAFLGAGLAVAGDAWVRFAIQGRGTPAPTAPPTGLVVTGLFRHVRDPMYVGILALIVGQAMWFGSWPLLAYAAGVWAAFHLFVVLYEEPTLGKRFGASYQEYRARVPRWIPR